MSLSGVQLICTHIKKKEKQVVHSVDNKKDQMKTYISVQQQQQQKRHLVIRLSGEKGVSPYHKR